MVEIASPNGVAFDLGAIECELQQSEPYLREGHTARTLVHAADMRVVLIAIKSGNRIPTHQANESAALHAISGHLRLHVGGRIVELPSGHVLTLERGLAHDVEAETDSAFVLTLGWPPAPPA
jgi:quercetin dioxygenase-like cupin family protein